MFATSERVRPCSARCSPRSVGRETTTVSPSWATSMSRGMAVESSPLGPLTRTLPGSIATVTPLGTGMGCLPMRDILSSPDLREDLAGAVAGRGLQRPRLDIALLGEDPGQLALDLRRRDIDRLVGSLDGVPDPCQEVGYGIGHRHRLDTLGRFVRLHAGAPFMSPARTTPLPGGLGHARDLAGVGKLAQADAAEAELAVDRARAPAPRTARVGPGL